MKISSIVNTLLSQALPPQHTEVSGSWTVCIPDGHGNVQRYATTSLVQAEATLNEWLLAGWPAWIDDANGNVIHSIGTKPTSCN